MHPDSSAETELCIKTLLLELRGVTRAFEETERCAQCVAVDGKSPGAEQNLLNLDGDGSSPLAPTRNEREYFVVGNTIVQSVHEDLAEGNVRGHFEL